MWNNEETGPSDQDVDEMDYEGEQEYLDFLTAKQSQGLQVGLDDGTDAYINTDGSGTDGGAETGGEGTGPDYEGLEGVPKKKERKRSGKITASKQARAHSSQTMGSEEVPIKGAAMFHITSEPMLPPEPLEALSGDLRRQHDHVLSTEKSLLASKDPGYPTYAARVPEGKCYVNTRPRRGVLPAV